jgi:hypothetical protein
MVLVSVKPAPARTRKPAHHYQQNYSVPAGRQGCPGAAAAGSAASTVLPTKGLGLVYLKGPACEPTVPPHSTPIFFGDPPPCAAPAPPAAEILSPREPVQTRKESAVECVLDPQPSRAWPDAVHGGSSRGRLRVGAEKAGLTERTPPVGSCFSFRGNHCGSSPIGPQAPPYPAAGVAPRPSIRAATNDQLKM